MPRVNGFEVLTELRTVEAYRAVPIVVLTVSNSEIDRAKSLELGAAAFVSKPLGIRELEQALLDQCLRWLNAASGLGYADPLRDTSR